MALRNPTLLPTNKPTAAIRETFPRYGMTTAAQVSGKLYLSRIELFAGDLVSTISFGSASTPASGITHLWAALYNSSLGLLRQSTDNPSDTWAANTLKTFTLSSAYPITITGYYYVGFCIVGTSPTVAGVASVTPIDLAPLAVGGISTASLTDTAPDPAATITYGARPYAYVA